MSQFLCCFSYEEIQSILKKCAAAKSKNGKILVADTFWDLQKHEIASYSIINTSPYFTAIANGNSKMYAFQEFKKVVEDSGLVIESVHGPYGYGNSLVVIR